MLSVAWALVHQPLALDLLDRQVAPLSIFHLPTVPPETELIAVAVQMLWRDVMESARHATLEKSKVALCRVCVETASVNVFFGAVLDALVPRKAHCRLWIACQLIGDDNRAGVDMLRHFSPQG